jgi:hypothetical protein
MELGFGPADCERYWLVADFGLGGEEGFIDSEFSGLGAPSTGIRQSCDVDTS